MRWIGTIWLVVACMACSSGGGSGEHVSEGEAHDSLGAPSGAADTMALSTDDAVVGGSKSSGKSDASTVEPSPDTVESLDRREISESSDGNQGFSLDSSADDDADGEEGAARADAHSDAGAGEPPCVPQKCDLFPSLDSLTEHPIVLVHGMFGFENWGPLEYWGGVEADLREAGHAVYTAVMDPVNGSDVRAQQLADVLDQISSCTCAQKVNIIGHSQGGIDARYLVSALDYADRVESITTVASPHGGTEVADALLGLIPAEAGDLLDVLAWLLTGIYTDPLESPEVLAALHWCSSSQLADFSQEYPHPEQVAAYSYAGRAGLTASGKPECEAAPLSNPVLHMPLTAALLPSWLFLGGLEGQDNDGLVRVADAKWGEFRGCIPADHVQEIGMFVGVLPLFDHLAFYRDHAAFLVDMGH